MKKIYSVFLLTACLFLGGCHAVIAPQPFGVQKVQITSPDIEGTWIDGDGNPLTVKILDQEKALVEITYQESETSIRTVQVHLMAGRKWQYASTPNSDEGDTSQGYVFACVKIVPTQIIVWLPDHSKFKKLVEDGIIKGKIIEGDVQLEKVTPELIELIESERYGLLFDWQEPFVFQKRVEESS